MASKKNFAVRASVGVIAVLASIGIAAAIRGHAVRQTMIPGLPKSARQEVTRVQSSVPAPSAQNAGAETPVIAETIAPLPPAATAVPDEDLLKLSSIVGLANARYAVPDKARWTTAIPIAQTLMAGPCDCEQRNWLKHFVDMGNDALANENDAYYEEANLIVTLGRNDAEAMARSRKPN